MPYLGLLDVAGIQDHVGRYDRLVNIAEASEDIAQLTHLNGALKKDYPGVTRIVAAAGNAAYTAEKKEDLRTAIRKISRELLENYPGLQLQADVTEYALNSLASFYGSALRHLELRKATQPHSTLFTFTGEQQLRERPFPTEEQENGIFQPREFANMICDGSEESHLMAIVSVDGLNMGGRYEEWLQGSFADDVDFATRFQTWSDAIQNHWEKAWQRARKTIVEAFLPVDQLPENAPLKARQAASGWVMRHPIMKERWIALRHRRAEDRSEMRTWFPCRKIYQGGDDMSFVCDARIALALTTQLMLELERPVLDRKETGVERPFNTLTVSAGILFVHYTFPYVRARELADEVRKTAKKRAMELKQEPHPPPSALDWWVNRQSAMERPEPLWAVGSDRSGSTRKPYLLHSLPEDYVGSWEPNWDWLERTLLGTTSPADRTGLWNVFSGSRNKLKDLIAEAGYKDGWARVERLFRVRPLRDNPEPLAWLEKDPPFGQTDNDRKPAFLLDTGELFDIHFPLPSKGEGQ